MGVTCLGGALYFAPTLFTTEKSLVPIKGKVENVKTYYTQVSSKGHKSVKSELTLTLQNDKRKYNLAKNIEQSWQNEKYELIEKELKESGEAIVWIKEGSQSEGEPRVFQIGTGEKNILYDLDDVKSELKYLFPLFLVIGLFGVGLYLYDRYPTRFRGIFGKKTLNRKT